MEFVIVLGSSSAEIRASRVKRAVEYLRRENDVVDYDTGRTLYRTMFVFTGKGGAERTEAEMLRDEAIRLGVEPNRCITEIESSNTVENLDKTFELLSRLGYFDPTYIRGRNVFTICTSRFHGRRTTLIAITSRLNSLGDIRIIVDEDDGDITRRTNEREYALTYMNSLFHNYTVV